MWRREYPTWTVQVQIAYPIGPNPQSAQLARARIGLEQSLTQIRSLELQIAAEVTNARLQVDANLKRIEAARVARELSQRRLEAEQSKFDVGLSTNYFVVQAQRDLLDSENTLLRAALDYQQSLVNFERSQLTSGQCRRDHHNTIGAGTATSVGGGTGTSTNNAAGASTGTTTGIPGTRRSVMRKWMVGVALVVAAGAGYFAFGGSQGRGGASQRCGEAGRPGGAFAQPPMTVELVEGRRAPRCRPTSKWSAASSARRRSTSCRARRVGCSRSACASATR